MDEIVKAVKKQFGFNPRDTVILAISGGVDSMVLLNVFLELAKQTHMTIVIAHVNHQLREQSTLEEQFLKEWAAKHHVQIEIAHWQVGLTIKTSVEEAARNFRYNFFADVMKKYQAGYVATAHNLNDQAETFLMKLVRGGIVGELGAIQAKHNFGSGEIIRPMLEFPKKYIKKVAVAENIEWYEDETNGSDDYLRNRIRHRIIPQLETENAQVLSHIMDYSQQIQEQSEFLVQYADIELTKLARDSKYDFSKFILLDRVTKKLVLRQMITRENSNMELGNGKLTSLLHSLEHSQANAFFDLGQNFQLVREYDVFFVLKISRKRSKQASSRVLRLENTYSVNGGRLTLRIGKVDESIHDTFVFSANQLVFPLRIKPIDIDIKLGLKNGGHKTVRRELIDQKIPGSKRSQLVMVVDKNDQLIWIPGLKKSWLSQPFESNRTIYTMIFSNGGSF
ncbi:tRNA lysidine(34) synthetase TilS [Pediococcus claussenii]|uniref:tRNA(Ile)-lysidine synthase n=1 Tax=Pediococcus claussenii (strain ATCC BAA-344 / DSM 14800 / JCM 18046 / KCTC 3811 / LMG 21948 / P06) TaxID=701521 RepID=G8PAN5_PEDCP|nr:tRNA lysidine(34) synthetase TilS [Pediococcus claussenii]AEV94594.1 tRNA(Ile)-lysidine synthetase [Pediococcus claussenii ATCC BAA-344]ANZ69802.1 hypothetical protein AYR57_05495 [Pediococcus claussenii]ANZ71619.1 hypothetical protein AYR58_05500 [Pediococcus claussenii]KRN19700.1 tilS protein [Pediococcus claussenii]